MGLLNFFNPPVKKAPIAQEKIDKEYKQMRLKVFLGIFFGYAADYLVRKNLSLAAPGMIEQGLIDKAGVGIAMANACDEALAVADWVAPSCDEDGVAVGIYKFCFGEA